MAEEKGKGRRRDLLSVNSRLSACMHWREGRLASAQAEIDLALGLVTDAGALLERAERMIIRGRILECAGDLDAARDEARAAIELYSVHGLDDHPNVAAYRRFEQQLAGASLSAETGPAR